MYEGLVAKMLLLKARARWRIADIQAKSYVSDHERGELEVLHWLIECLEGEDVLTYVTEDENDD